MDNRKRLVRALGGSIKKEDVDFVVENSSMGGRIEMVLNDPDKMLHDSVSWDKSLYYNAATPNTIGFIDWENTIYDVDADPDISVFVNYLEMRQEYQHGAKGEESSRAVKFLFDKFNDVVIQPLLQKYGKGHVFVDALFANSKLESFVKRQVEKQTGAKWADQKFKDRVHIDADPYAYENENDYNYEAVSHEITDKIEEAGFTLYHLDQDGEYIDVLYTVITNGPITTAKGLFESLATSNEDLSMLYAGITQTGDVIMSMFNTGEEVEWTYNTSSKIVDTGDTTSVLTELSSYGYNLEDNLRVVFDDVACFTFLGDETNENETLDLDDVLYYITHGSSESITAKRVGRLRGRYASESIFDRHLFNNDKGIAPSQPPAATEGEEIYEQLDPPGDMPHQEYYVKRTDDHLTDGDSYGV